MVFSLAWRIKKSRFVILKNILPREIYQTSPENKLGVFPDQSFHQPGSFPIHSEATLPIVVESLFFNLLGQQHKVACWTIPRRDELKSRKKSRTLHRKTICVAVTAALPALITAGNAHADCSGSVASPFSNSATIFCTGANSNVNNATTANSNSLTITPATNGTNATNSLYEFQGLGKTLTNSGTISNGLQLIQNTSGTTQPTLTRIGVLMGSSTINDTTFSGAAPAAGTTTVIIKTGGPATYVGQTITFGRLDAAAGDFFAGEQRTIIAYDPSTGVATLDRALSTSFAGNGNGGLPYAYNVVSGSGTNTINNTGTISASISQAEVNGNAYKAVRSGSGTTYTYQNGDIATDASKTGSAQTTYASASNTSTVRAIDTSIAGDYVINNANGASISASHAGVGGVQAIDAGGSVTNMTINNAGNISISRTAALTLADNTAASLTVTSTDVKAAGGTFANTVLTKQSLGSAGAIYSQEELESITINNAATGVIEATGNFTPAIYLRAGEQVIVNEGIIRTNTSNGFAIGSVSDGGEIRTLDLQNSGTITGDILAVNGNAARWFTLSKYGTLDNRLNINNNWGELDSTITNSGTIIGNLYYSNGTHVLSNEAGAVLTGNIDIDQRDTVANGQTPSVDAGENTNGTTVIGTKSFTFENAGTFNGNLTIRTASSTALGSTDPVVSQIRLIPTITGSGAGSSLAAPSASIAGMGNTLNLITTAGGDHADVTLQPKVAAGAVVKDGEFFKVATTYQINGTTLAAGAATLPNVESSNSLISWAAAVNDSGNLVLESEVSTGGITGVSGSGIQALNTLLGFDSELGSRVQNLDGDAAVRKAAEQLRPEINNGSFQTALAMTDKVFGLVDSRLEETQIAALTGRSGVSTGEQANGTGVWFQGFGFRGEQDRRKGVDGYTADAYGFAFGADSEIGDGNIRVGAAFSYGNSNVDDQGVNRGNRLDIDSYQATLYGSRLMNGWYLNGALAAAKHDIDSKRVILGSAVDGNHDAWQYTARIEAGMPLNMGAATVTPVASLTYSLLDEDSYSEHGTGALHIGSEKTSSIRSGLGAKALIPLSSGAVSTDLELRAIWNHEFANAEQDATARFVDGGTSFRTNGVDVARNSANLGASLKISGGDKAVKQSLLVSYDAEVREQYVGQTARLQARFDF
jgi:outer membrane autotransporter protein